MYNYNNVRISLPIMTLHILKTLRFFLKRIPHFTRITQMEYKIRYVYNT